MTDNVVEKRLRYLVRLTDLSRVIVSNQDLETILLSLTEVACDLTECECAFITLVEQETGYLKFIAGPVDLREDFKKLRVPIEDNFAGKVYKFGGSIIRNRKDIKSQSGFEIENKLSIKVNNIAGVPLIFRDNPIGVLYVTNKYQDKAFTREDISFMEILASQAIEAIIGNQLLDEIKFAFDQIDELERMKSNFIAITSHELRTPLGLIIGHATYLNELISDEPIKQEIEVIIRSANKLSAIIENISKVSNYQTESSRIRFRVLSLQKLINQVIANYQNTAREKKINFRIKLPDKEVFFDGDEEKILLILNNLIDNALAFTDEGGEIEVSAENKTGYLQVSIKDNGVGIPERDLPKIFDRFFQVQSHLTRKHGGMGLGLSVAKAMIELHSGQIHVKSTEGKGSEFVFTLPIAQIKNFESGVIDLRKIGGLPGINDPSQR